MAYKVLGPSQEGLWVVIVQSGCHPHTRNVLTQHQQKLKAGAHDYVRPVSTRELVQQLRAELAGMRTMMEQQQQQKQQMQQQQLALNNGSAAAPLSSEGRQLLNPAIDSMAHLGPGLGSFDARSLSALLASVLSATMQQGSNSGGGSASGPSSAVAAAAAGAAAAAAAALSGGSWGSGGNGGVVCGGSTSGVGPTQEPAAAWPPLARLRALGCPVEGHPQAQHLRQRPPISWRGSTRRASTASRCCSV
jgi:hypothetical protein